MRQEPGRGQPAGLFHVLCVIPPKRLSTTYRRIRVSATGPVTAGGDSRLSPLAKEMRGRDVTVNAVAPGPTATPLYSEGKSQEVIDRAKQAPPLERLGEPADIAEAVAFLAGPARWVNGQIVYANGGVI